MAQLSLQYRGKDPIYFSLEKRKRLLSELSLVARASVRTAVMSSNKVGNEAVLDYLPHLTKI